MTADDILTLGSTPQRGAAMHPGVSPRVARHIEMVSGVTDDAKFTKCQLE